MLSFILSLNFSSSSMSSAKLHNFKSLNGNYKISDYDSETVTVNKNKYRLLSDNFFNIYNETQVIALFKELGYNEDFIINALEKVNIPKSRENLEVIDDVNIYSRLAKGQNASAASTVFENLSKDKKGFHFEKKLHTTIGGTANLDGFYDDGFRYIFVETKCHEIYSKKSDIVSKSFILC